jgi:hypothetical protein
MIPYVAKRDITLIAVGDALEATAVRAVLEGFNYRPTTHWVGSRAELLMLLAGEIPVGDTIVLSCHGDEGTILVPDEPPVTQDDLRIRARLHGKTVVNLGCETAAMAPAFRAAGTASYIAPTAQPDGSAALAFVTTLFFLRTYDIPLQQALHKATTLHPECEQFTLN